MSWDDSADDANWEADGDTEEADRHHWGDGGFEDGKLDDSASEDRKDEFEEWMESR